MRKVTGKVRKSDMIDVGGEKPLTLSYISSGLFLTGENWIHPKRQIDSHEVMYVVCGRVFIREEDTSYPLSKGDMLILSPGKTHSGYQTSAGKTSFYWAHFKTSDYSALGLDSPVLPSSDRYNFTDMFRQLLHFANTSDYPDYAADLQMLLLLNEIAAVQRTNRCSYSKLTKDIAEWVRINSDRKITVETTADYFGYNPDYLSLLFKKAFGIGLKQYIDRERVTAARNLLLTTRYSVKQIAGQLGWEDENHFINFFKYHEAVSPTSFRNRYYNTHFNKR